MKARRFELLKLRMEDIEMFHALYLKEDGKGCCVAFNYKDTHLMMTVRKRNTQLFDCLFEAKAKSGEGTKDYIVSEALLRDFLYDVIMVDFNYDKNFRNIALQNNNKTESEKAEKVKELETVEKVKEILLDEGFVIKGVPAQKDGMEVANEKRDIRYVPFVASAAMSRTNSYLFVNVKYADELMRAITLDMVAMDEAGRPYVSGNNGYADELMRAVKQGAVAMDEEGKFYVCDNHADKEYETYAKELMRTIKRDMVKVDEKGVTYIHIDNKYTSNLIHAIGKGMVGIDEAGKLHVGGDKHYADKLMCAIKQGSVAIDEEGRLYIGGNNEYADKLMCAIKQGSVTIDKEGKLHGCGNGNNEYADELMCAIKQGVAAIDESGKLHVCGNNEYADKLMCAIKQGSVTIDKEGKLHVCGNGNNEYADELMCAIKQGVAAIDESGKLHVCGNKGYADELMRAIKQGVVAIDESGKLHVCGNEGYADELMRAIKQDVVQMDGEGRPYIRTETGDNFMLEDGKKPYISIPKLAAYAGLSYSDGTSVRELQARRRAERGEDTENLEEKIEQMLTASSVVCVEDVMHQMNLSDFPLIWKSGRVDFKKYSLDEIEAEAIEAANNGAGEVQPTNEAANDGAGEAQPTNEAANDGAGEVQPTESREATEEEKMLLDFFWKAAHHAEEEITQKALDTWKQKALDTWKQMVDKFFEAKHDIYLKEETMIPVVPSITKKDEETGAEKKVGCDYDRAVRYIEQYAFIYAAALYIRWKLTDKEVNSGFSKRMEFMKDKPQQDKTDADKADEAAECNAADCNALKAMIDKMSVKQSNGNNLLGIFRNLMTVVDESNNRTYEISFKIYTETRTDQNNTQNKAYLCKLSEIPSQTYEARLLEGKEFGEGGSFKKDSEAALADGCGFADDEFFDVLEELITGNKPEEGKRTINAVQIRLPWIKGLLIRFSFMEYIKEANGWSEGMPLYIRDVFDKTRDIFAKRQGEVTDPNPRIKLILTASMFKGYKWFKELDNGNDGSKWHVFWTRIKKHGISLVIAGKNSLPGRHSRLNYQFLSTIRMSEEQMNKLAERQIRGLLAARYDDEKMKELLFSDVRENMDANDGEGEFQQDVDNALSDSISSDSDEGKNQSNKTNETTDEDEDDNGGDDNLSGGDVTVESNSGVYSLGLAHTTYARDQINVMIHTTIMDMMRGRLKVDGDVRYIVPDLLEMIAQIDRQFVSKEPNRFGKAQAYSVGVINDNSLIAEGYHGRYFAPAANAPWIKRPQEENTQAEVTQAEAAQKEVKDLDVVCLRNPHLSVGEDPILKALKADAYKEYERYFGELDGCVMVPAVVMQIINGADVDGDRANLVCDPIVLKAIRKENSRVNDIIRTASKKKEDLYGLIKELRDRQEKGEVSWRTRDYLDRLKAFIETLPAPEAVGNGYIAPLTLYAGSEAKSTMFRPSNFSIGDKRMAQEFNKAFCKSAEQQIGKMSLDVLDVGQNAAKRYNASQMTDKQLLAAMLSNFVLVNASLDTALEIDIAKTGMMRGTSSMQTDAKSVYELLDMETGKSYFRGYRELFKKNEKNLAKREVLKNGAKFVREMDRIIAFWKLPEDLGADTMPLERLPKSVYKKFVEEQNSLFIVLYADGANIADSMYKKLYATVAKIDADKAEKLLNVVKEHAADITEKMFAQIREVAQRLAENNDKKLLTALDREPVSAAASLFEAFREAIKEADENAELLDFMEKHEEAMSDELFEGFCDEIKARESEWNYSLVDVLDASQEGISEDLLKKLKDEVKKYKKNVGEQRSAEQNRNKYGNRHQYIVAWMFNYGFSLRKAIDTAMKIYELIDQWHEVLKTKGLEKRISRLSDKLNDQKMLTDWNWRSFYARWAWASVEGRAGILNEFLEEFLQPEGENRPFFDEDIKAVLCSRANGMQLMNQIIRMAQMRCALSEFHDEGSIDKKIVTPAALKEELQRQVAEAHPGRQDTEEICERAIILLKKEENSLIIDFLLEKLLGKGIGKYIGVKKQCVAGKKEVNEG